MSEFNVKDKVQHRKYLVLGTVTETANRCGVMVYRVSWSGSPSNDFTWHVASDLQVPAR